MIRYTPTLTFRARHLDRARRAIDTTDRFGHKPDKQARAAQRRRHDDADDDSHVVDEG